MFQQDEITGTRPARAPARTGRGSPAAAGALIVAGVCFALYPAIRPFTGETSLRGARAFASSSWLVAHSLAIAGFILLALGLSGLCLLAWNLARPPGTPA